MRYDFQAELSAAECRSAITVAGSTGWRVHSIGQDAGGLFWILLEVG